MPMVRGGAVRGRGRLRRAGAVPAQLAFVAFRWIDRLAYTGIFGRTNHYISENSAAPRFGGVAVPSRLTTLRASPELAMADWCNRLLVRYIDCWLEGIANILLQYAT